MLLKIGQVFWICISLLQMAYAVAILVGASSSFIWSKVVTVICTSASYCELSLFESSNICTYNIVPLLKRKSTIKFLCPIAKYFVAVKKMLADVVH